MLHPLFWTLDTGEWVILATHQMSGNNKSKFWCFTLNNYNNEDEANFEKLINDKVAAFLTYGREIGESGTEHLQGYIEFIKRKTLRQIKKFNSSVHWERRKGTAQQAINYCHKDDEAPVVLGTRISCDSQGKRSDLLEIGEILQKSPYNIMEIAKKYPSQMIRYGRGIREYASIFQKVTIEKEAGYQPRFNLSLDWSKSNLIIGDAGIGKTVYAIHLFENPLFVTHLDQLGHYNETYDGIIFDDMSFSHLPRTSQIMLVDTEQPRAIHVRYRIAMIPAKVKKVFLSNTHDFLDLNDAAIKRRVKVHNVFNLQ